MELLIIYLVILAAMVFSYKMGYHAGKLDATIKIIDDHKKDQTMI